MYGSVTVGKNNATLMSFQNKPGPTFHSLLFKRVFSKKPLRGWGGRVRGVYYWRPLKLTEFIHISLLSKSSSHHPLSSSNAILLNNQLLHDNIIVNLYNDTEKILACLYFVHYTNTEFH